MKFKFKNPFEKIAVYDIFFVIGFGGLFYGVYLVLPWLAYVIGGTLLMVFGLGGAYLSKRGM